MDNNLFIYFWLDWIFSAGPGVSLVAVLRLPIVVASLIFGALALGMPASVVVGCELWRTDLAAPWHVESSQTRDQTQVPCVGRSTSTTGPPAKSAMMFLRKK